MIRYALLVLALLLSTPLLHAQRWGSGPCSPVRIAPTIALPLSTVPPGVEAKARLDATKRAQKKEQDRQDRKKMKGSNGCGCRSMACECDPDDCPCQKNGTLCNKSCDCVVAVPVSEKTDVPNFGVDFSKINVGTTYFLNGKAVTRQQAYNAVVGSSLADDSTKEFVTIVGDRSFTDKVKSYLDSLPGARDKYHVQAYGLTDWVPRLRGYKPGVTLTDAKGKVLAYAQDVTSADLLDKLLKRVVPNNPLLPSEPMGVPLPVWVLGGIALLLFLYKKDK